MEVPFALTFPYVFPDQILILSITARITNMNKQPNILIVDDDFPIAQLVKELVQSEGFEAQICLSGHSALSAIKNTSFDLILCDIMMPEMDGFEFCREVRSVTKVPIIFVTAKGETVDKVSGLTLGADDYITKPFDNYELIARIKGHLRRVTWDKTDDNPNRILAVQNLILDPIQHECHINGRPLNLAPKEFKLLLALMTNPQTPHSVQELFENVWEAPYDESGGNSVMVHMRRLRKKLASLDNTREYITTVWGVGYKMQL